MKPAELVRVMREAGISLEWRAGRVWARPRSRVTPAMEEAMRRHREVVQWAIQRRLAGHPANEIWLSPSDWEHWMYLCGERIELGRVHDEAA
jgi:hypothetical protein